jgi:hypothetical protein
MEPHDELATIYVRQADRAQFSAGLVATGGGIASLAGAILTAAANERGEAILVFLGVLGAGSALTAALYAAVSALRTHAEARAARHGARAPEDESEPTSALP